MRYMLYCLVVKVLKVYLIIRNNIGIIQNFTIGDSLLKKKYIEII